MLPYTQVLVALVFSPKTEEVTLGHSQKIDPNVSFDPVYIITLKRYSHRAAHGDSAVNCKYGQ